MGRVFKMSGRDVVGIDEETQKAGVGPIDLDVAMARDHGWSEKAITRCFLAIRALSRKEGTLAQRAHPELYATEGGETIFIGPSTRRP